MDPMLFINRVITCWCQDVLLNLVQLVCLNGSLAVISHDWVVWLQWLQYYKSVSLMVLRFCSCPDTPGTEKLAICALFEGAQKQRLWTLKSEDLGATKGLAPPMSVFNIKGWTRTLAATVVMRCAYECDEFVKALSNNNNTSVHSDFHYFLALPPWP